MNKPFFERGLEAGLFAARWLLAPIYVGLAIALAGMLGVFAFELWSELTHLFSVPVDKIAEAAIVMALSLIDLSLAANLMLIVIFSGYENFVSRINTASHEDQPDWMGTVDFSGLKMKLIASIVAISAIALLKSFLVVTDEGVHDERSLLWQVVIHLTFVVSGVVLALMDLIAAKAHRIEHGGHGHDA